MVNGGLRLALTVRSVRPETAGHASVIFDRPAGFVYQAGDWLDFVMPAGSRGGVTYSLSSAPTEPHLMVTFRHGLSDVKQRLANLQPGEQMVVSQYGNDYKFHIREHAKACLIAGGVGVAPFRSMIAGLADSGIKAEASLLYFNRDEDFLFKAELDGWAGRLPGLHIEWVVTAGLKKKDRQRLLRNAITGQRQTFYIAGPPSMVESTEHMLLESGIGMADIRIDSFSGY